MDIFAFFKLSHLSKSERVVITVSLMSSFVFLLLFFFRPSDNTFQRDLRAIAKVERRGAELKRKFANSLSWGEVSASGEIFQGDEVFNEENESVIIEFLTTKNKIILPPKSLIAIEDKSGVAALEVKEGRVEVELSKDQKMEVKNGDKILDIAATEEAKVTLSNAVGELSISTSKGSVDIVDEIEDKKTELKTDQVISVSKEIKIKKLKILSPLQNQEIDITKEIPIISFFSPTTGEIKIAQDMDFKKIVLNKKIKNKAELSLNDLEEGNYFLQVITPNEKSEIRSFKVTNTLVFSPLEPTAGQTILLKNINDSIKIRWDNIPNEATVDLEIVNKLHVSGEKVLSFKDIKDNHYIISGIRGDSFLYRGRVNYKGKSSPYSRPIKVKTLFESSFKIENNIPEIINTSSSPMITWKKASPDELVLITLTNAEKEIIREITESNSWSLAQLKKGQYQLHLSSLTYPTSTGGYKKSITVYNPAFNWSALPLDTSYNAPTPTLLLPLDQSNSDNKNLIFDLKTHDKKKIKEIALSEDKNILVEGYGKYCLSARGNPIDLTTDSDDFCFEFKPSKKLSIANKTEDQILKPMLFKNKMAYKMNVTPAPDATKYEFVIYKDAEAKKKIFQKEVESPELLWENSPGSGMYYFKYRIANTKDQKSDYSLTSRIIFPISPNTVWPNLKNENVNKNSYFYHFTYRKNSNENLTSILKKFTTLDTQMFANSKAIIKILNSAFNQDILNQKNIHLFIPINNLNLNAYKKYEKEKMDELKTQIMEMEQTHKITFLKFKEYNNEIITDKDGDKVETLDVAINKRYAEIFSMQKEIEKRQILEKEREKEEAIAKEIERQNKLMAEKEKKEAIARLLAEKKRAIEREKMRLKELKDNAEDSSLALSDLDTFGYFVIENEESFEEISDKIYGDKTRAKELQELNRSRLKKDGLKRGLRIIFVKK